MNLGTELLPTPQSQGEEAYETRAARKGHKQAMSYLESNVEYKVMSQSPTKPTSRSFQLNPLFVEEMMNFPFLWTTLPFLTESGVQRDLRRLGMLG